jgi:hypothetical protein
MIPRVDDLRALGDFSPLYKWELTFMEGPLISNDISQLNFRCVSASLPMKQNRRIPVNVRGLIKNQSGISVYNNLDLVFVETIDNTISQLLQKLHEATYAANTGVAYPQASLEFTTRLTRMDRQGNAIWAYQLIGCWLEQYNPAGQGGGLGSEAGIVMPALSLCYDYFVESTPDNI